MSIYLEKKNGNWRVKVTWYENGRQRSKSKQGFRTKALARAYGVELENARNSGLDIGNNPYFPDYFESWYDTFKKNVVKPNTRKSYQTVINIVRANFKNMRIKEINRWQYQRFINSFGQNHAPNTVKAVHCAIKTSVKSAVADGLITVNFCENISLTANQDKIKHVEYLNLTEIKALVNYCLQHRTPAYTINYLILTAIMTGARFGEIAGLKWADLAHGSIQINKQWNYKEKELTTLKTANSRRTVSIPPLLYDVLQDLKENDQEFIFKSPFGLPSPGPVGRSFRRILKILDIDRPGFHFHSLRHSHVAYLLSQGFDIYTISKRLGHADTATTARVYAYLLEEYKDQTNQKIVKALEKL